MMVLFFSQDGLGNQIFQYAFLKTMSRENEIIITIGFDRLKEVLNVKGILNVPIPNKFAIRNYLYRFFKGLCRTKIIGYVYQKEVINNGYKIESISFGSQKGLLNNIKMVDRGFFQSEKFFNDSIKPKLKIRSKYYLEAIRILAFVPENKHKIFIHVRRGDYLKWNVLGKKDPSLPIRYYRDGMNYLSEMICNPYYIFLSDDPKYCEEKFCDIKNKIVTKGNNVGTDLAIMTLCDSGVLANSSLSWWGAYLMERPNKLLAPKYWLGFKSKIWFPEGVMPSFAECIEVKN